MPEASQYLFAHRELTELLIKASDVHEGKWILMVNFGFSGGNFGPTAAELSPGAVVAITQIGIQRADPALTPDEMTVDASVANPAP